MRKTLSLVSLFLSLCVVAPLAAQGEAAPDYTKIRQITTDSKDPSYYPVLMQKFIDCDTTLTLEDYRNLYYGFALREDYIPYQRENKEILAIRRKLIADTCNVDLCPKAIKISKEALSDNPFDLIALSIIPVCYLQIGDTTNYHLWNDKLHGILDAINSSGNGESAETAIHVINIQHEYEIFNRLNLELDQVEVVNAQTEFIRAKENTDSIKGVYFNFGVCSNLYRKKYK